MSGSGAGVGEPAPAGRAGGRLPRRLIAAALAVVAGTATACAGMADPEEMTSAASSTSPSSANGYRNGTQIRAEVRYSAADDLPVAHVAIGLDSSVELVITGNPSGPVHLRGYERYAEPAGGSTCSGSSRPSAGASSSNTTRRGEPLPRSTLSTRINPLRRRRRPVRGPEPSRSPGEMRSVRGAHDATANRRRATLPPT